MIELATRVAQGDASRVAIVRSDSTVTYGELHERARRVAGNLRRLRLDRFAVVDDNPIVVIPMLLGASWLGAEACVYPPTSTSDLACQLATRLGHATCITSRADLGPAMSVVDPAELTEPVTFDEPLAALRPHLVLTTGTTGEPKAVRHDWSRLTAPVLGTPSGADERWLLAYGMNQFGGLQVIVHVLAAGASLVVGDSFQPRAGLAAMTHQGVTHASATPTFWRFVLAELSANGQGAPPLQQITLGGEAAPPALLEQLKTRFPEARLSHVYAANEFGSAISVTDARAGLPLTALEREGGVQLKIEMGQLWVRSPNGMLGYYGEPDVVDGWRPTGDLVEVVDERVLFRGRTSDVINVGGIKVHPLQVEERIADVDGIAISRVYGRPNALTGAVVAVEIVPEPEFSCDAIEEAVREACADLPPAARPRSVRFVDSIETIGHKLRRSGGGTG